MFMQKLSTSYTMYFNTRYERDGALFQGRFKAQDANDDRYLKYLIAYIHLNPVKLIEPKWKEFGVKNVRNVHVFLDKYPYSSYLDYCGIERPERYIIETNVLPDYFETAASFRSNMLEWIGYVE